MRRLEVSGAVRLIYRSLGVKGLILHCPFSFVGPYNVDLSLFRIVKNRNSKQCRPVKWQGLSWVRRCLFFCLLHDIMLALWSCIHANNGSNSVPVSEMEQSGLLQDNKSSVEYSIHFVTLSNYIFRTEQSIIWLIQDKLQLRLYILVYLLWDPTSHKFY